MADRTPSPLLRSMLIDLFRQEPDLAGLSDRELCWPLPRVTSGEDAEQALTAHGSALPFDGSLEEHDLSSLIRLIRSRLASTGMRSLNQAAGPPARAFGMSDGELTVLRLVAQGFTSREIAERLGATARSVGSTKGRALRKLGVESQAQAVALAVSRGLMAPGAVS